MKRCSLCEFTSSDAQEFESHMRSVHASARAAITTETPGEDAYKILPHLWSRLFVLVQVVVVALWGLVGAFAWLMQRNIEGWHLTTPVQYVVSGVLGLGLFLLPLAFVFGIASGRRGG